MWCNLCKHFPGFLPYYCLEGVSSEGKKLKRGQLHWGKGVSAAEPWILHCSFRPMLTAKISHNIQRAVHTISNLVAISIILGLSRLMTTFRLSTLSLFNPGRFLQQGEGRGMSMTNTSGICLDPPFIVGYSTAVYARFVPRWWRRNIIPLYCGSNALHQSAILKSTITTASCNFNMFLMKQNVPGRFTGSTDICINLKQIWNL